MPKNQQQKGCPKCGGSTSVKDSRPTERGDTVRRRKCDDCGYRYSTYEMLFGPHERSREVVQWAAEHGRDIFHGDNP